VSTQPLTHESFKAALTASGRHADEIGWAEDPEARRDEGAMLLRRHPDGSCEVLREGRGTQTSEVFPSEAQALDRLAETWLRPADVERLSDEERRTAVDETQRRARQRLAAKLLEEPDV
jgi:hypothetical protein